MEQTVYLWSTPTRRSSGKAPWPAAPAGWVNAGRRGAAWTHSPPGLSRCLRTRGFTLSSSELNVSKTPRKEITINIHELVKLRSIKRMRTFFSSQYFKNNILLCRISIFNYRELANRLSFLRRHLFSIYFEFPFVFSILLFKYNVFKNTFFFFFTFPYPAYRMAFIKSR